MTSEAARVVSIHRYPVKSMGGEALRSVTVDPLGIEGDRRLAVRDLETGKVLSAKVPKDGRVLLSCQARTLDDGSVVLDLDGSEVPADDRAEVDAVLSRLLSRAVHLDDSAHEADVYESWWPEVEGLALSGVTTDLPISMLTTKGTFVDLAALHLVTTTSMQHLTELTPASAIDEQRFRPSVVLATGDEETGFVENDWAGRRARLGTSVIEFGSATPRCVMTTLEQGDLPGDKRILQTLAAHNRVDFSGLGDFACLGVYAEVAEPGTVAVGDALEWLEG